MMHSAADGTPRKPRTMAELERENALFHEEIMVARRASEITASLVVEQFQKMEAILHQLEDNLAVQKELRRDLAENLEEVEAQKQELASARNAAESANAAKSAFLASTSHELRTPLTSVLGFARIIQKRFEQVIVPAIPNPDRKMERVIRQVGDNLAIIVEEGERLTSLINNVLDLAKIESGRIEWKIEPVSLADIIDRSAAATSSLFHDKPLTLELDVDAGIPPAMGDRNRLVQVLINLIANAVKFTEAGSITCRARCTEEGTLLQVIDTGIGIAVEDQDRIFENFTQAGSDTLSDKPAGTGLGLAICKQIVEYHGGRIWVESAPGRGSVFSFSLPIAANFPSSTERTARPANASAITGDVQATAKTLLVVDDEANIRELIRQELDPQGYRILCADSGEKALHQARKYLPDLVLLDLMLPGMNGYEVLADLKRNPQTRTIPVIIVSILEDKERGFRSGAEAYFTKPINSTALLKEVKRLLERTEPGHANDIT